MGVQPGSDGGARSDGGAALAEQQLLAAEDQLLAAEEQLRQGGGDVYELLEGVQLAGLLDGRESATRVYLSLARIYRALHRRRGRLRAADRARQPELEPEPEPAKLRNTSLCAGIGGADADADAADAAAENVGSAASSAAFQDIVHPCELDTTSTFERRDNLASSQQVAATASDPGLGIDGATLVAGVQVVPRLQLGESLLAHDGSSGPRTRSSRRLSARLSLESTRGTPNNTGRSLRSVRLHVQDDTVRPPTVGLRVQPGSGCAPSASRQLQILAERAAGVFMARRSAGIVRNVREKRAMTARQAKRQPMQRAMAPNWVEWRSQHRVVDLMRAVTTDVLNSSRSGMRCGLDMDVAQLPVNALVADLMSITHQSEMQADERGVVGSYRASVLRLCCQIGSIVDIWAAANDAGAKTSLGPDTRSANKQDHPKRNAVLALLPGHTASDETRPVRSATSVSATAAPIARTDRVVLRLARTLKGLVHADTLEDHRVSCCLSVLADYIKLRPALKARRTFDLFENSLRKVSGRTLHGREFNVSIHFSSVEVVHCLVALLDIMLEPSADWLVVESSTANWMGAYCCWILTVDVGVSKFRYSVGEMQSQAIRYVTRCAHAWRQRNADGKPLVAGDVHETTQILVSRLINTALSQDHTASINTSGGHATAVLELVAEVALPGRFRHSILQDNLALVMYYACTTFLRAYFQQTKDTKNETLCCTSIKTMLLLLQIDSSCAVEQIERLNLVSIVVEEISGEYLCSQKKNVLNFTAASSNKYTAECGGFGSANIVSDSAECAFESDYEGYGSELSDSLDSRYSGVQDDSYSCSEDFSASDLTKAPIPSLQLSGPLVGAPGLDAAAVDVNAAGAPGTSSAGSANIDLQESMFLDGRRIYDSDELHLLVLQLIMALIVTSDGSLSPAHWSRTPAAEGKPNLHDLLYDHLNHSRNRHLIPALEKRALSLSSREGVECLLKLLCADMFDPSSYTDRTRLASGANATVYRCNLTKPQKGPKVVALKVIDRSSSANHFCPLPDVFSEIRVLMRLRGCEGACQLIDYGVGSDSYYIALKCYTTSLRKWRLHQDTRSDSQRTQDQLLALYLHIYRRILTVTDKLAMRNIIHFDIKCDNVLMSPAEDADLADFWDPTPTAMPQYDVVLADFGVGKLVGQSEGMHTVRNRGTECIKSPEMILADSTSNKAHPSYDRRRKDGSTNSSDVWSLGCLLYECEDLPFCHACVACPGGVSDRCSCQPLIWRPRAVVTGKFLFDDNDFARFFARVCSGSGEPIVTDVDRQRLKDPRLATFLEFMLVRDPAIRPSIEDVCRRFDVTFAKETCAGSQMVK